VWKGGYVVTEAEGGKPAVTIVGTGSEVGLAVAAQQALAKEGIAARAVSLPCLEVFKRQSDEYRRSVIPDGDDARICVVEAGRTGPWYELTGKKGLVIGLDRFGASAPGEVLAEKFGLTADAVTQRVRAWAKG
jgi:transketolase